MTTRTIMRNGSLSRARLLDEVYTFCNDGETTDEEITDKADDIVIAVNKMLPGSLYWVDETSEIWANVEDETSISEEDFEEYFSKAFQEVLC